jgi:hypothetical protein
MTNLVIITAACIIILALLAFRRHQRLKAKAKQCSKEAKRFHEKLKQLSDPSHLFSDEELHRLKWEFAPLLAEVNELYDNFLISNEYLDELGLKEFMDERKLLNHIQYQNNQKFKQ